MGPKLFCTYSVLKYFTNTECLYIYYYVFACFQKCNGQEQSPIDVKFNGETLEEIVPLVLSNYDEVRNY